MSAFHNNALIGSSNQGYTISRSVRLRSSATAYFNRTPASASNRTTWTWSAWVKRGKLGAAQVLFSAGTGTAEFRLGFISSDAIEIYEYTSPSYNWQKITTAVYRDPSAWYHIELTYDTTNGTAANRIKLYVNGAQVTSFSTDTNPTSSFSGYVNSAVAHGIGSFSTGANYLDGYLTEINFIDGQALTPSSFGETDAVTGVWKPKKYAGTYGTNGFYLNFSDNSNNTAATIGKDYSGNGNNWTPNNISVTSGATYDSMLDVPTQWADGGNGRGNYCTLNPIAFGGVANRLAASNANLSFSDTTSTNTAAIATIAPASGKWYFELACTSTGTYSVGLIDPATKQESFYRTNGAYSSSFGGGGTTGYSSWTNGDVIGVAWDADAGKIWYAKNNVWQGSGSPSTGANPTNTFTAGTALTAEIFTDNSAGTKSGNMNFGAGSGFSYTPPSGFKALNTQNLPDATIKKGNAYFDATTYTGNGSTQSIVNSGSMQPDFIWFKNRSGANNHALYDSVRGRALGLISNATNAEQSASAGNDLVSFDTSGFSVGPVEDFTSVNGSAQSIIAWQWNAGGSTVTNTSGTISSQVRANPTAGFSVVTFTGTGSAATVGHGLGVAPQMIIAKTRNGVNDWFVYTQARGATKTLYLNLTNAEGTTSAVWNNTSPTSTVFTVGTTFSTNTCVAYCFAAVAGYSAFGSYTGNGSTDGPFVFTGFRPRFVMFKRIDSANVWSILDSARDLYNATNLSLQPSSNIAEETGKNIDFLSNGFKQRQVDAGWNASGGTYIYAAFAENPFKNSLAR